MTTFIIKPFGSLPETEGVLIGCHIIAGKKVCSFDSGTAQILSNNSFNVTFLEDFQNLSSKIFDFIINSKDPINISLNNEHYQTIQQYVFASPSFLQSAYDYIRALIKEWTDNLIPIFNQCTQISSLSQLWKDSETKIQLIDSFFVQIEMKLLKHLHILQILDCFGEKYLYNFELLIE